MNVPNPPVDARRVIVASATERLAAARQELMEDFQEGQAGLSRSSFSRDIDALLSAHRDVLAEGVEGLDLEAATLAGYANPTERFMGTLADHLNAQHRAIVGALRERVRELEERNEALFDRLESARLTFGTSEAL